MTQSSLTEETPATPGWVDASIAKIFGPVGDPGREAREAYATCLAGVRGAVDVDAGHDRCRAAALRSVAVILVGRDGDVRTFDAALQALEAEIAAST